MHVYTCTHKQLQVYRYKCICIAVHVYTGIHVMHEQLQVVDLEKKSYKDPLLMLNAAYLAN